MKKALWENGVKISFGALGIIYFLYLKRYLIQEWDIYQTKKRERDVNINKVQFSEDNENIKSILDEEKNKTYRRKFDYNKRE
ncbi:conserved Plasmodium protein, unknown function [Plasmodium berghei]|uniref:Uncharacterized protein n=3 Tax=Plasmodium berghei TaxID=5821 RepID=A0A509AJ32_PLABA|nr:conserved Plasmodium protein, unknown function [Plasmodium berghei ANKA]CXI45796.1 conserved Plasmodium protein, unknown function [Plasmodium berghei]SCM22714.1 conserved Plasmodium protein, unknown function [Plasmodium berghei]SCO60560.1 conserved Plasmodium protein, unknown function [Plasmodium berghei]SCO62311.1 conserved Plasmodium protein, unknown function [Plasmodium berghei]VUC55918.1 conserved Plasmodium protein, unknown function [Plasmodium berghei ANKA]|eukprot:XP_034421728.1 conserved Plasmodium protein, unknown function [Plasmodium berghei ANKA]